jgi:hypothetical protein
MVFLGSSENEIGKFCWSEPQDLLLRAASFGAPSSTRAEQLTTSTARCIPKTFLIREIPTLRLSSWFCFRFGLGSARGQSPSAPSSYAEGVWNNEQELNGAKISQDS